MKLSARKNLLKDRQKQNPHEGTNLQDQDLAEMITLC